MPIGLVWYPMRVAKFSTVLVILVCSIVPIQAQRIAVSTNVAELLTLTPNIEVELPLNHKRSFALTIDANPIQLSDNLSFEHLSVSGEYRFWIDQVMYAHYVSAVVQVASNNYTLGGVESVGDICALGVGYGYSFLISRKINIVPNISFGCGYSLDPVDSGSRFKPALLNLGVSFQYLIK